MANLTLDATQLESALHAAVLNAIGEDAKALIVNQVVEYLTKTEKSPYGKESVSPLRQAINDASYRYAQKYVTNLLELDSDFQEKLKSIFVEAVEMVFADREKIVRNIAEGISKGINGY